MSWEVSALRLYLRSRTLTVTCAWLFWVKVTGRLFATEDNFTVAQVPLETRGAWAQGRPGAKEGEEGLATASARFSWAKQGRVNSEDWLVSITPAGFGPGLCPGDLGLGSRLACKSAKGRVVACVEVGSPTGCSLSGGSDVAPRDVEMS